MPLETVDAGMDRLARRVFEAAIREDRCGELLLALFDGESCTVDPVTGKLLIIAMATVLNDA